MVLCSNPASVAPALRRKNGEMSRAERKQGNMTERGDDGEEERKRKKQKKQKSKRDESESGDSCSSELPTVSIAVCGSIIDNTQSLELATRLAGQIARAATIFRIHEVIVFDDKEASSENSDLAVAEDVNANESGASFLTQILRYLETPQYLRRTLLPKHNNLRFVGMLPPLDAPHHVRKHEWVPYREGVTLKGTPPNSTGTRVDVGLYKDVVVEEALEPGVRVTVEMGSDWDLETVRLRKVVNSSTPREETGVYWGYKVRYASNISSVFKDCPYKGGYDYRIGTSEHGLIVNSSQFTIPTFRHLLIAFGGLGGLEENIEEDINLKGKDVREVFDSYLNTCPHQGSRTIRTEEAIFISLQFFQEPINHAMQPL